MDIKKSYEAPSLAEVGSVEGLTLGQTFNFSQRDNVYFYGWQLSLPGGPSKGS